MKVHTTTVRILHTPPPVRVPYVRRDGKVVYVIAAHGVRR